MMGCCWPKYNVTWYLCPYYDMENTGLYNWNYTWNQIGTNNSIKSSNTPAWSHQLLVCMSLRKSLITKNAAIMYGMYIINGEPGPEPRSSWGNTSCNTQISALIPRPAFNGMEKMCQHHVSNQNSHPPVLVRKPLRNQFIHYHIS